MVLKILFSCSDKGTISQRPIWLFKSVVQLKLWYYGTIGCIKRIQSSKVPDPHYKDLQIHLSLQDHLKYEVLERTVTFQRLLRGKCALYISDLTDLLPSNYETMKLCVKLWTIKKICIWSGDSFPFTFYASNYASMLRQSLSASSYSPKK